MIEPHTETAQIFQFADARQKFGKKPASQPATDRPRTAAGYFLKEDVSETCKNARLRSLRHDNWRKANTLREYWSASVKMMDAIERVQHHNILEGNLHPEHKQADRWALIAKQRVAIVRASFSRPRLPPRKSHGSARWSSMAITSTSASTQSGSNAPSPMTLNF